MQIYLGARGSLLAAGIGLAVMIASLGHPHVVAAQSKKDMTLDDLRGLKTISFMEFSPDGSQLAYLAGGHIFVIPAHGGSEPKQLVRGGLFNWSPDSTRIAYYADDGGMQQLFVVDVKSEKFEQITKVAGGIRPDPGTRMTGYVLDPQRFSWSPDGAKIVFASQAPTGAAAPKADPNALAGNEKTGRPLVLTDTTPAAWTLNGVFTSAFGPPPLPSNGGGLAPLPPPTVNQLFIVDVAAKQVTQFTTDPAVYFNPAWSPDGKTIVCASDEGRDPGTGPSNIYSIDVATGAKTALTHGDGDKRIPLFSPDGRWIAYVGGAHFDVGTVFVIPSAGGTPVNVGAKVNRYILDFGWLPDSKSLAVIDWDAVNWPVVRVRIADGSLEKLTGDVEARRANMAISRDGAVAWMHSDGTHWAAIVAQGAKDRSANLLVDLNPQMQTWNLGEQEVVHWKNSRGEDLEGVLIKPVGFKAGQKYPLIVDAYPARPNGFQPSPMLGNQMQAGEGYAIFMPAARTPHTWMNAYRDKKFDQATKGPQGWDITLDDVMTGVDEVIRSGIADPDRMGLYGFSNGGGVVNYLVTRTNRFKCAVSVAGVYPDWFLPTFLDTNTTIPVFEGGTSPWDDPEAYVKLSAIFRLKEVSTPMLLADGDNDGYFLLGMIELYNGLRYLGKDVTFLRYAGQGHGFTGAAMTDFWQRENEFFNHYLHPSGPVN